NEYEIFGHRVGATEAPTAFYPIASQELLIYASSQDDVIGLSADAQGNIFVTSGGKALVPIDPASGKALSLNLNNTQSIQVFLDDGRDRFEFAGNGFQAIPVRVYGGAGEDHLILRSAAAPGQVGVAGEWIFDAGQGTDTFEFIGSDLSEEVMVSSYLKDQIALDFLRVAGPNGNGTLAEVMAEDAETIVVD